MVLYTVKYKVIKYRYYEVIVLRFKRLISLLLAVLLLMTSAALCVSAADEAYNSDEEGNAVKHPENAKLNPEKLGYAAYAKKLDTTVYDKTLGSLYTPEATVFRLWSPVATEVKLCIYKTGSDSESGAQIISSSPMKYSAEKGLWYITLKGDYKNLYYTYKVTAAGETHEVVDPYARAVGVNGDRAMIVDLRETDPEGWADDSFDRVDYASQAVVWEVSVRDFSASPDSGVSEKNRGKFMAFSEAATTLNGKGDTATCVAYLKELGVNYVQINPFYDFASIDESDTETPQYNWGYDPKNYNAPEGSYSSDPYDGRVRIKECKAMIQALHQAGIGVIMDVVYNHTYYSEDSFFNYIVPSYYHRVNEDGTWSNGSGCGNDVATERYMVRRFIRDSVVYWAKEYHIDGFRFDLMGLMDVDTMNGIRTDLDKLSNGKRILMYGEAWNLSTTVPADVKLANQDNMYLLSKRIGAFNDAARDAIKGSVFNLTETGFVQTGSSKGGVRTAIDGDGGGWASVPNQCVNYSSCHDNLTLYDKLVGSVYKDEEYDERREDLLAMNKLSAAIILMSRGMPFFLAGEEMARTKHGDENSYKSSVEINQINWSSLEKYTSLVDYYKGLIKLRAAVGVLNDADGGSTKFEYLETDSKSAIAYTVSGSGYPSVVVVLNGGQDTKAEVVLPEGKWVMVVNGDRAGAAPLGTFEGIASVEPCSAAVFVDQAGFSRLGVKDDESLLYIRYKDAATSKLMTEQRVSGAAGESYNAVVPDSILFYYNIVSGSDELSGIFEETFKVVDVECEAYEGGYSSVTFKFLDKDDNQISDTVVLTNRIGQQYYTQYIPGVYGYRLDLDSLPVNGAGVFAEDPIEVIYRYSPEDSETDGDDYSCSANVIYMSESGEILAVKSLTGAEGDRVVPERLTFDGYKCISPDENTAAFSALETNMVMDYEKKRISPFVFVAIAAGIIVAMGVGLRLSSRSRRRKMNAIEIED